MGIQGLLKFLKDATSEIHIREYAGRCVAVDTYCWLHRGAFACADKLAKGEKTDQYVKYCMKFVDMLESYNVRPILVFDGCHLPSKKEVEKQRRERRELYMQKGKQFLREGRLSEARDAFTKCVSVTPQMALSVMKVARERGIDCIVAPYEADAQLAYLLKQGYAQAVVTEDSDLLCFGCEKVILKMDLTGRAQEVSLDKLELVKNLQGFTIETFRHMCILSGCDYLPSIKGIGLAKSCKALKLAKNKDIYQTVRKLHQYIKGLAPVEPEYAIGFERADKTFLYQLVVDPKHRKIVPLNDYTPDIQQEDLQYAGPMMSHDHAVNIAWGNIDINNGKRIGDFNVDTWMKSKSWNGESVMRRSSIWQKDFFSNNKHTDSIAVNSKREKAKQPAKVSLRGKEATIDMKRFLYSSKSKKQEELLGENDALKEVLTQYEEDDHEKEDKIMKKETKDNQDKISADQTELLEMYKTSKSTIVPSKSSASGKLSRLRMTQNNKQISSNCIVKSRFFAAADNNPSFIEDSDDHSSTITHVDETPETSNGSIIPQPTLSDDGTLNEILQEIETKVKVERKSSPTKQLSIHSIKSPKKQKYLLEKLQEYQKQNDLRSPLLPRKVEKSTSVTPLKRKNPFAVLTDGSDKIKSEFSIYNKRKASTSPRGTPACLKRFKRKVIQPHKMEVEINNEVEVQEIFSSNKVESQEASHENNNMDKILYLRTSGNEKDNFESELNMNETNEDIPLIDDPVFTKSEIHKNSEKGTGKPKDIEKLKLQLTPQKLIVSLKKLSPEDVSYEDFISIEKYENENILNGKNSTSVTTLPQQLSEPIVLSSDEENIPYIDDTLNMPKKRQRTVGLNRKTPPQPSSGLVRSKYFGSAKASGLRKKESMKHKKPKKSPMTEKLKNQPKITSLFTKTINQPATKRRTALSPKEENVIINTPETEESDVEKIKLKMMATRKLFGLKIK
uniref:exonuclease 1-like isoform X2 n=1 Tax=Styela clava TaxID=7725 RepID=UPI00193A6606|nr:exonuclease 1-like isoform X2 [Styela clava]